MAQDALAGVDDPIVVEAAGTALASVIWLHGLGADGHDFEELVLHLGRDLSEHVRFVFPHAPRIPVTINGGMTMRAWYDISETELGRETELSQRADEIGVRGSGDILCALIERERGRGIEPRNIVLAGFSQGGAIALHTGLRYPVAIAGVLALSTYLPLAETCAMEGHDANRRVPIFMGHGSQDPLIPLSVAEQSRATLTELGYVVEVHTYPMPHSVCPEEIRDIADWLSRTLRATLSG